jgi:TPR repeat protein
LLVACSAYSAGEFRKLPGTVVELRDFRLTLLDSGFDARDVVFLHDDTKRPARLLPEKKKILQELDLLLGRVEKEDTLLVALNGHGLHFKGDKIGYFVPLDGRLEKKETLLPMEGKGGLFEKLKDCKAGRKLLLVNACRNDPLDDRAFAASKAKIDDEDRAEVPEGIAALYSCRAGQRSYEYPSDSKIGKPGRSLFYHHVIEAWKGRYSEGKAVTVEHVFREVRVRTARDASDLFEKLQQPQPRREYRDEWLVNERVVSLGDKLFRRGFALLHGQESDEAEAVKLLRQSAQKGHALARAQFAACYFHGWAVEKDEQLARRYARNAQRAVKEAAEAGDADAQYLLGKLFREGLGVEKDPREGLRWTRKAAEQDHRVALWALGWIYESGEGVQRNDREALRWYRKAADNGFGLAMNNVGWMYANGKGVAKDYEEAVRWYRKAIAKGSAPAMNNLGYMYEHGQGVRRSRTEAVRWYRRAAKLGDRLARENLKRVGE